MDILQVNFNNVIGGRFNGRELNRRFRELGHSARQCVWLKEDDDPHTWMLADQLHRPGLRMVRRALNHYIGAAESLLSLQSLLYPWPALLLRDRRFRRTDLVHYHLLNGGYFSLHLLPRLTSLKPSVLTLHDPWLLCGHCVHPYGCERWKTGCGECPDLATFSPLRRDRTRYLFETKRRIMARSEVDVVVASRFMYDMALSSPIFENHRIHHIPFGIDLDIFRRLDAPALRRKHGIGGDDLVIAFRETESEWKGLPYIRAALRRLAHEAPGRAVTLLTVGQQGLLEEFRGTFSVVELGHVADDRVMAEFFNCCDLFLMPSTAEAFGMMAIEAMACGRPVIAFEGTAVPSVIHAPAGGLAVPMRDAEALFGAIERLGNDPAERGAIGEEGYRLSRIHYDFADHARRMLSLYQEVVSRSRRGAPA